MTAPSNDEPKVKGAVIRDPRNWARTAYGAEAYQLALSKLPENERAIVDGLILPGEWYSLAMWDRFLDAMREEARARTGHTAFQFDMRNMREAGSSIVRGVYKFFLALMSATSVIDKAAVLYGRLYSEGRCEVVENVPGRAVVRYCDASPALRSNLTHNMPTGLIFALELNRVANPSATITKDQVVDGKLAFEVTVTYDR